MLLLMKMFAIFITKAWHDLSNEIFYWFPLKKGDKSSKEWFKAILNIIQLFKKKRKEGNFLPMKDLILVLNFFISLQNKFVMFSVQQKHKIRHISLFLDIEIIELFTAHSDDCQ